MVYLDASKMTTRELNTEIRRLAGRGEEVVVLNPQARHNLAVGVLAPCRIVFEGSVGYYCAALCEGVDVWVKGNAGWALGENLMDGRIVCEKNVGSSVAASIRGGEVFVAGSAGARAGISMKGGTLLVKGNAGFLTGFMMQKGQIIVCGNVGHACGDSMYEGVIYVGGEVGSLGNDAKFEEITDQEVKSIAAVLQRYGIEGEFRWKKIVSAKRLYHYDTLELFEKGRFQV